MQQIAAPRRQTPTPYLLEVGGAPAIPLLSVITEPTRRRVLDAVRGDERSVTELVDAVGMHRHADPGI